MSDAEKGNNGTVHANPPPHVPAPRRIGNPAPLGLFGFASTTLILSLFNVKANGITVPNAVLGMALFYGGLAQFIAGMWEFASGNTFGATAFSSYGAFWLSFGTFYVPASGIIAEYQQSNALGQLDKAIGIYLMSWMTVTFIFLVASLRKSVAFIALFFFLTVTFLLLGASKLSGNLNLNTAGGALGIVTALVAYYIGFSDLLGPEDYFQLPLGRFVN